MEFDREFEDIFSELSAQCDSLCELNRKVTNMLGKEDTRDMLNLELFDQEMELQKLEERLFWRDLIILGLIFTNAVLFLYSS